MKRPMLIFSLILSFLTLFFLIFQYFGFIRNLSLRFFPPQYYAERYARLPKADEDRVVLLISKPEGKIKSEIVNSLLDQTVRVDDIAITLKYKEIPKFERENKDCKDIFSLHGFSKPTEEVKKLEKVNECSKLSEKERNEIMYTILREPEAKTKILIIEPNRIYENDFVQSVIEYCNEKDNKNKSVLKYNGILILKPNCISV